MSRSHRPHQPSQSVPADTPATRPRTAWSLVAFALVPPAAVVAVARPIAAVVVVTALGAALAARRVASAAAPSRVVVRVPWVRLRVEVGLAPAR